MSYIITLLIEIFIISKVVKIVKKAFFNRRKKPKKFLLNQPGKTEIIELNKQEKQRLQEIEKRRKQAIKQAEMQEKKRQKHEQAEADIIFYQQQLDKITDMLIQADNDLQQIEKQIEINNLMRSYDKVAKEKRKKAQIINRIMNLETKIHNIESQIAKANYILAS